MICDISHTYLVTEQCIKQKYPGKSSAITIELIVPKEKAKCLGNKTAQIKNKDNCYCDFLLIYRCFI